MGTFDGDDVGIVPHAAEHRSQWPWRGDFHICVWKFPHVPAFRLEEAVKCHIKFTQMKNPPVMRPVVKIL